MNKIAINGLGRIGRAALKIIIERDDLELTAVNDLVPIENLVYLLKFDSVYGKYNREISTDGNNLIIEHRKIRVLNEKDPSLLPWKDMDIDIVIESTGVFTKKEGLEKHIKAGAKKAILSAPSKSEEVATVVYGINKTDENIISCASCTTTSITPVIEIMSRRIGVRKAIMTTCHAYTASQPIVDLPEKKVRRGRAGAINIVPTTTGAAKAAIKVLPQMENRFDGIALRVPVPVGSIADMVFVTERKTSAQEVNDIFREEAKSERYRGILSASDEELVSSDIIKDPHTSIIDLGMTQVVDGDLVKILSWYDNEWGYAYQMVNQVLDM